MRAKGYFWLATRPDWVGELAVAGSQTETARMGRWWASIPKNQWPDDGRFAEFVARHWDRIWGDRRQELVFIGALGEMNRARITALLDKCLVAESDFVPDLWKALPDPLPRWGQPRAA